MQDTKTDHTDLCARLEDACRGDETCKCSLNEAAAAIRELEFDRNQWRVDCEEFRRERDEAWRVAHEAIDMGQKAGIERMQAEAALAAMTQERDEVERRRVKWMNKSDEAEARLAKVVDALREWDALIKHQYNGSREAMSDMTYAAKYTAAVLAEIEGEKK